MTSETVTGSAAPLEIAQPKQESFRPFLVWLRKKPLCGNAGIVDALHELSSAILAKQWIALGQNPFVGLY